MLIKPKDVGDSLLGGAGRVEPGGLNLNQRTWPDKGKAKRAEKDNNCRCVHTLLKEEAG